MRLLSNGSAIEILYPQVGNDLKDESDVENSEVESKYIRSHSILNPGLYKKDIKRLDQ